MEYFAIADVFRMHHPNVSVSLFPYVLESGMIFVNESDHPKSPIIAIRPLNFINKGRGTWRMNPVLLKDAKISVELERIIEEFSELILPTNDPFYFWCLLKENLGEYLRKQANLRIAKIKREKKKQRLHFQNLQRRLQKTPNCEL